MTKNQWFVADWTGLTAEEPPHAAEYRNFLETLQRRIFVYQFFKVLSEFLRSCLAH